MADNTVEIVIQARDQATKQLNATKQAVANTRITAVASFISIAKEAAKAAKAIVDMANAGSVLADRIGDMANKLNVSTETLSTLRLAANVTGSSLESMETGLRTLNRQALVAAQGSKSLSELFARLGVSIKDSNGNMKETEDLMREVSDGLANVQSGTERAAIAQTLFGRSGADLIPILGEGSQKLDVFRKRAEELGVVIDGEAAAAADRFQDSIVQVREAGIGLSLTLGNTLLPAIQPLIDQTIVLITQFANWVRESGVMEKAGRLIAGSVQFVAIMMRTAVEVAQRLVNGLGALALAYAALTRGDFAELPNILKAAAEQDREIVKETQNFIDKLAGAEQASKDFNRAANETTKANQNVAGSFDLVAKMIVQEEQALAKLTEANMKSINDIEVARLESAGRQREADALRLESNLALIESERQTEQQRLLNRRAEVERTVTDEEALRNLRFLINEQLLANDAAAHAKRLDAQDQANKRIVDQWTSLGVSIADNAGNVVAEVLSADMTAQEGLRKIGEDALKQILNQFIDNTLKELLVAQLAETAKATIRAPLSFGASLAALVPIAAAYVGARGAITALKLQRGGLVEGGTPGRDSVPALLEPGELVLPRPVTNFLRGAFSGGTRSGAMQEGGVAGGGAAINIERIENVSDFRYVDILIERLNDLVENHGRRLVASETV